MKNLQNKYIGRSAIIIFGGSSCIEYIEKIKNIDKEKYVVFLEAKSLTPKIIDEQIEFDYLLATFPNKLKDNSFQNLIFKSFLSNSNIKYFIKSQFHKHVDYMLNNFHNIIEDFRPHRGIHKKYKYKRNIYLKDSPLDLLIKTKNKKIITNLSLFNEEFKNINLDHHFYYINHNDYSNIFNIENYFNPVIENNILNVSYSPFLNSAAINFYPIIKYMGIKKIYLLGMDMNLLGNLQYSANYFFKNDLMLNLFFLRNRKAFNANFKINFPCYLRPKSELQDLKQIINNKYIQFIRVSNGSKYEYNIPFIKTISLNQFFK